MLEDVVKLWILSSSNSNHNNFSRKLLSINSPSFKEVVVPSHDKTLHLLFIKTSYVFYKGDIYENKASRSIEFKSPLLNYILQVYVCKSIFIYLVYVCTHSAKIGTNTYVHLNWLYNYELERPTFDRSCLLLPWATSGPLMNVFASPALHPIKTMDQAL